MDLYWSTKKPKKPGWYWVERNCPDVGSGETTDRVIEIMNVKDVEYPLPTSITKTARWAGPIPKPKNRPKYNQELIDRIISYLNRKCGTNYKSTTNSNKGFIQGRLNDGFTPEDFKTVIDNQYMKWFRDPEMRQYLRPATLFCASKFESYLNNGNANVKSDVCKTEIKKDPIECMYHAFNLLQSGKKEEFEEYCEDVCMPAIDRQRVIDKHKYGLSQEKVNKLVENIG